MSVRTIDYAPDALAPDMSDLRGIAAPGVPEVLIVDFEPCKDVRLGACSNEDLSNAEEIVQQLRDENGDPWAALLTALAVGSLLLRRDTLYMAHIASVAWAEDERTAGHSKPLSTN
jgi:hypothetical protein